MNKQIFVLIFGLLISTFCNAQVDKSDWADGSPEGCTSVTAGIMATIDGSVITSHTDDSHRTRSWMDIIPAIKHKKGSTTTMYKRMADDSKAMPAYKHDPVGEIPQVKQTYGFVNTAYPCMNEYQLGVGESTFGGRPELQSDAGIIDCQRLIQLMLERTKTAREAIELAGSLLKEYGWNDAGECMTIADPNEVWHLEVVGPGKGEVGAVWVAQRVPDDHISVNANASTIKAKNPKDKDFFLVSDNIYDVALKNGWWKKGEEFRFCYAYAPESRNSIAARRREWRVFDLLAPSLKLDPNAENYPFSVKPDNKVSFQDLVMVFQDFYEGTDYNFVKDITVTDEDGKTVISPMANPFMPYDMNKAFRINGGWGWRGERTIARWYTMYATIIQCRNWLPDDIGGVVWLAQDNVASSIYIPVFAGTSDLPKSYKTPGRVNGYTRESAWWAFNRLGTLAAQRWGDMRKDLEDVWQPMQNDVYQEFLRMESRLENVKKDDDRSRILTEFTLNWGEKVVGEAWRLGDFLWTKYDEKF